MPNLLIHFVSDFLRNEELRCQVMEDEEQAYTAHGLSDPQKAILRQVRDGSLTRQAFLTEIGREIAPIRFESGAGIPGVLHYPDGEVEIHSHRVDSIGNDRWVHVVGIGFVSNCTVTFRAADGTTTPATLVQRSCDVDVWQRIAVRVTLPPGLYTMTIDRGGGVYQAAKVVMP